MWICVYLQRSPRTEKDTITPSVCQRLLKDTSKHASLGMGPTSVCICVCVCVLPAVALKPAVAAAEPGAEGETRSVASAEE